MSDATFVPHDQVKVLELMPNAPPVQIVKAKRDRLLTLPRMQRGSPPTQLIRAVNGDYLRARLVAMDEKQLQVEVQLETQSIPRAGIARIIWLHADETEPQANKPAQPERLTGTRVQAIPRGGNRLTFYAEELAGSTLSGQSDLLGSCRVELGDVDELLVGKAIEQAAAALAFHNWRLTPAVDPLEFQEGAAEGGVSDGMDSVLVGKPAPELELDLSDGKRFRLAERKGRIVVIDFWASWCGPCLQAMPQVHEVTREFADQQVELVGVNLQESPEQIKAALEKLGLSMAVALDRDGRVAERYGATAIPQTVIVDREGKVARLFVGGGAGLASNCAKRSRASCPVRANHLKHNLSQLTHATNDLLQRSFDLVSLVLSAALRHLSAVFCGARPHAKRRRGRLGHLRDEGRRQQGAKSSRGRRIRTAHVATVESRRLAAGLRGL